ncbi:transposable element gene [Prunus dulcis]|uniref:Transposable element protein n=1 Tax=Prunus dulcis TaxID=3755 RepID=A0A4Y1QKZ2_PRUDU|nr:transposable element gene [Prunus dulcis]
MKWESWISAIMDEMESLHRNSVWELIPKPKDRKVIGCKWVFRKKEGIHEKKPTRFKVHLVDIEVEQMDVKMVFLRGYLEEDIYMSQSHGFIEASKGNLVCRLKNSLYRLQQSPRQWYKHSDTYMLQIWYRRCDCCVYSYVFKDGKIILLLLYVDDMLIACQDMSKVRELKSLLGKEFDMKDLGPAIKDPRNEDKKRPKFGQVVVVIRQEKDEISKVPYASAVGCLMYAIVCIRPDLAQVVSVVSRYMKNLGKQNWNAVKWIFLCLKDTKKFRMLFERQQRKACVSGYVDSDYMRDLDKRRSTTRFVFTCVGGPIICTLSTTEAEYMTLTEASKEAICLRRLAKEFGIAQDLVVIQSNSQSVKCLVKNQVNDGEIAIENVQTCENASDCLTKPVATKKFKHCLSLLNLVAC